MNFSLFVVCGVFLMVSNFCSPLSMQDDEEDGPTEYPAPKECAGINPENRTEENEDDYLERNLAKIALDFRNRTSIGIRWTIENKEDEVDLCGFTLHWHKEGAHANEQKYQIKEPNHRNHLVTNLNPGTKYSFHVVTYYATNHKPRSWLLSTITDGCGPDISLDKYCNPKGAKDCNPETDECICKGQASGSKCDTCPDGFYLHNLGCVSCDNCVSDGIMSNGTCRPAPNPEDTMMCNCIHPYTGKHCRECEKGYYWKDRTECLPCNCFHDKEEENKISCDPSTGKCKCGVGRAGDKCERCAEGYTGNAVAEGCTRSSHAGITALIIIITIIVILVAFLTFYLVGHRRCKDRISTGFWKIHLREEYDKVNFTTLEEEPDYEGEKERRMDHGADKMMA